MVLQCRSLECLKLFQCSYTNMIRGFLFFFFVLMLLDTAMAGFLPRAFEGEFEQIKESIHSGTGKDKKMLKSSIIIKYEHPGQIYFKDLEMKTLYICNTKNVYKYDPPMIEGEEGFLSIGDSNKFCYSKIFDSLKSGLKSNKNYTVKNIKNNNYELMFDKSAQSSLGFSKIIINFSDKSLEFKKIKSLEMHLVGQEKPVKLVAKSIKYEKGFSKDIFNFEPPAKTTIEKME